MRNKVPVFLFKSSFSKNKQNGYGKIVQNSELRFRARSAIITS